MTKNQYKLILFCQHKFQEKFRFFPFGNTGRQPDPIIAAITIIIAGNEIKSKKVAGIRMIFHQLLPWNGCAIACPPTFTNNSQRKHGLSGHLTRRSIPAPCQWTFRRISKTEFTVIMIVSTLKSITPSIKCKLNAISFLDILSKKRLAEHRVYDSAVEIKILLIPGDGSHRTEVLRRIPANGRICGKHLFTAI